MGTLRTVKLEHISMEQDLEFKVNWLNCYMSKQYKLDKTAFKGMKAEEAKNDQYHWSSKSLSERLQASYYLNSIAYDFDRDHPPVMNKSVFELIKR